MTRQMSLVVALGAAACARKREDAPTEMNELVLFLFQNWEDDELLPEAVDNMGDWVARNIDLDDAERGFQLESIPDEVADVVDHPDAPNETIGVVGMDHSAFGLADHATHVDLPNQIWSNPKLYEQYDRTLTEGSGDAFRVRREVLRTSSEVITSTLGVTIPYVLVKDYRWVTGEDHEAIVARAWIPEASCGDGGSNCVEHTYSVDLWFADGAGASQRATASWSQLVTSIPLGEDTQVATLASGIQNVFAYTDSFLAGETE